MGPKLKGTTKTINIFKAQILCEDYMVRVYAQRVLFLTPLRAAANHAAARV